MPHIHFARYHVGDQAGAVFADQVDFTLSNSRCLVSLGQRAIEMNL
jgi:hypothetical protein